VYEINICLFVINLSLKSHIFREDHYYLTSSTCWICHLRLKSDFITIRLIFSCSLNYVVYEINVCLFVINLSLKSHIFRESNHYSDKFAHINLLNQLKFVWYMSLPSNIYFDLFCSMYKLPMYLFCLGYMEFFCIFLHGFIYYCFFFLFNLCNDLFYVLINDC